MINFFILLRHFLCLKKESTAKYLIRNWPICCKYFVYYMFAFESEKENWQKPLKWNHEMILNRWYLIKKRFSGKLVTVGCRSHKVFTWDVLIIGISKWKKNSLQIRFFYETKFYSSANELKNVENRKFYSRANRIEKE